MQRTTRLKVAIVTGLIAAPLALMFAPDADADTHTAAENAFVRDMQHDGISFTSTTGAEKAIQAGHLVCRALAAGYTADDLTTDLTDPPNPLPYALAVTLVRDAKRDLCGSDTLVSYTQAGKHGGGGHKK